MTVRSSARQLRPPRRVRHRASASPAKRDGTAVSVPRPRRSCHRGLRRIPSRGGPRSSKAARQAMTPTRPRASSGFSWGRGRARLLWLLIALRGRLERGRPKIRRSTSVWSNACCRHGWPNGRRAHVLAIRPAPRLGAIRWASRMMITRTTRVEETLRPFSSARLCSAKELFLFLSGCAEQAHVTIRAHATVLATVWSVPRRETRDDAP